jgi:hypothetical protein
VRRTTWISRWRRLVLWMAAPGVAMALATITAKLVLSALVIGGAASAVYCCHRMSGDRPCSWWPVIRRGRDAAGLLVAAHGTALLLGAGLTAGLAGLMTAGFAVACLLDSQRQTPETLAALPDLAGASWTETQAQLRHWLSMQSGDVLCAFWRATQALDQPLSGPEQQRLLALREQCLDEFHRRVPGQFQTLALLLLEHPDADLRPYLVSSPSAADPPDDQPSHGA